MHILLALIATIVAGIGVHFALPQRELRGVTLAPAIAGALGGVGYTALTWAGITEGDPLLWVYTIGGSIVLTILATLVITRRRASYDRRERERLRIA